MKTLPVRHKKFVFLTLTLLFCGLKVFSQDFGMIQFEVWADFQPMGENGPREPLNQESIIETLLEETRTTVSGMIYGYRFLYRPSDLRRDVSELFTFEAIHSIPRGDPGLRIVDRRVDRASVYLKVRYYLKEPEQRRLEAWTSNAIVEQRGQGRASYFDGLSAKAESLIDSCKQGVRNYARGLTKNKPAEVRGEVLLVKAPRIYVASGEYRTESSLKIKVESLEPYLIY